MQLTELVAGLAPAFVAAESQGGAYMPYMSMVPISISPLIWYLLHSLVKLPFSKSQCLWIPSWVSSEFRACVQKYSYIPFPHILSSIQPFPTCTKNINLRPWQVHYWSLIFYFLMFQFCLLSWKSFPLILFSFVVSQLDQIGPFIRFLH